MIDGLLVTKITENLKEKLQKGKLQKIYQINDNELLIKIRANQQNYQLLNSIQSNSFRLHLTNHQYSTLEVATNFTMVLRKQLEGGIIKDIFQHECERTIIMEIVKFNELRDEQTKYLIFELTGRHSNTILCNSDYTVIQSLKFIPLSDSLTRIIHKGAKYEFMSSKNKLNPLLEINNSDNYLSTYQGFSRQLNNEFIFQNNKGINAKELLNNYLSSKTIYVYPKVISYIELEHLTDTYSLYDDLDEAFDNIYTQKNDSESITNFYKNEIKTIKTNIKRNKNKIEKLLAQEQNNQDYQKYQELGTLLYDNIYQFDKNKHYDEVTVFDYENNKDVIIKLDSLYNISQNAQMFLKKYQKIKKSFSYIEEQITVAQQQNEIYEDVLDNLEYAKVNDVKEILDQLREQKLLKGHPSKTKKKKNYKPKYEEYLSSDNTTILVGKNNIQNDYITFNLANKDDYWLHIKNLPGAHVVIKDNNPSEQTIMEAAQLAVYFSKTQAKVNYDVDYTQIKNLKKIKGSKLGNLTFNTNKTINVINDITITAKLKRGA